MQHAVCVQVLHAPGSPAAHVRHLGPCQLQRGRVQHPIQRAPAGARYQYSLYLKSAYKDVIAAHDRQLDLCELQRGRVQHPIQQSPCKRQAAQLTNISRTQKL